VIIKLLGVIFPPSLIDVRLFFLFSDLFQFVGGVPHDPVKNTATDIFTIDIAPIGKFDHGLYQLKGFFDVCIAGFHVTHAP